MYLKIRIPNGKSWIYIDGFVRLEAQDQSTVYHKVTDEEIKALRYDNNAELCERVLSKLWNFSKLFSDDAITLQEMTLQEASAFLERAKSFLDYNRIIQDSLDTGQIRFRLLKCFYRDEKGNETSQPVLLNTEAYLCSDHGHTMDRFIVNKGN